MNPLDTTLLSIAHSSMAVCSSVSEALAKVFRGDRPGGGVTLTLQSRYGVLLRVGETMPTIDLCSNPLLSSLYSGEGEERIALLFGTLDWNMASCFSLSGIAFYPVITIPAPPEELRWVRYELLAALDCFSLKCKHALREFVHGSLMRAVTKTPGAVHRGSIEKALLEKLLGYSLKVDCATLIDNDGFVLIAAGKTDKAEAVAGALALFNRQTDLELDRLGSVAVRSLSLGNETASLLIGRTPGRNVSLAISVTGEGSRVIARFLFDAGIAGLASIAGTRGAFGDYRDEPDATPSLRKRTSWLSAPRLVPKGAYAALAGEKGFHDPECAFLDQGRDADLRWFATRAEAIKTGFLPCVKCNP
jgi:hypothetical protein